MAGKSLSKKPVYYVASFSGGKDSTAMVLRLIELGYPLHEVVCCDTTMEFPAMYRHIERVRAVVEAAGVKFTMLRAEHGFEWWMLEHKPKQRLSHNEGKIGFSWPGPRYRWCTNYLKGKVISRYLRDLRDRYEIKQYIGLAADEQYRLDRNSNKASDMIHPLVIWGWTAKETMAYCRSNGYDWEGLYELFRRVSCWCCPLQPLSELRKLYVYFPELWSHLKELDERTWRTFKEGYSVAGLEKRFDLEIALEAEGESTNDRAFHNDLKAYLSGKTTIVAILDIRRNKPKQISINLPG